MPKIDKSCPNRKVTSATIFSTLCSSGKGEGGDRMRGLLGYQAKKGLFFYRTGYSRTAKSTMFANETLMYIEKAKSTTCSLIYYRAYIPPGGPVWGAWEKRKGESLNPPPPGPILFRKGKFLTLNGSRDCNLRNISHVKVMVIKVPPLHSFPPQHWNK